jgi:SnoaL-like protein
MAKRGKKASKKTAKAAAKKGGKKKAARASKRSAKKAGRSTAPKPVSTGRGPGPKEIGMAVVESINAGRADRELWDKWWSPKIESVEGHGMAAAWRGRKAMEAKNDWWSASHTVHGASAEGPYLGATGFSIKFRLDAEEKATGKRTIMEEVGVYTVQNGKVVREEFMYGPKQAVPGGAAGPEGEMGGRMEG